MAHKAEGIENVYTEIGKRLRWLREQLDLSARELAERIGVHPSSLVAWENAIARPGIAELLRIVHALKVPVAAVLADLPIKDCLPPAGMREKRKATALKRVAKMRENGQLGPGARKRARDGKGEK